MTEEEFKKVMTKTVCFIVVALVLLIVIGIFVFNKSGKTLSVFSNQKEIDDYKKKVQEVNSSDIVENDESQTNDVSDNSENTNEGEESIPEDVTEENNPDENQIDENTEQAPEEPVQ